MADTPQIEYPSRYEFKVMGRSGPGFADHVRALVSRVLAIDLEPADCSEVPSRGGAYLSVRVTVLLRSEEQRRAVYTALHQDPRVVYYL